MINNHAILYMSLISGESIMSSKNHSIYISHNRNDADDERYKQLFQRFLTDEERIVPQNDEFYHEMPIYLTKSDVREKMRESILKESTVTVVLIGKHTWKSKQVDWEISSSISDANLVNAPEQQRSGLVAILLPTHPNYGEEKHFNPYLLPPRLYQNHKSGYVRIHKWTNQVEDIRDWIHNAFVDRYDRAPDDSYPMLTDDLTGEQWLP